MEQTQQTDRYIYNEQKGESEIVRFLLEQERDIETKLLYYKGYTYDSEADTWTPPKPNSDKIMLNEQGVDFASRNLRRFLNKNAATANLTEKQVSNLTKSFSSSIRKNLLHNLRKFGINSTSTVDEVKNDITDMAFVLLTQSISDKGRKYIHTPRKMTEVRQLSETIPDNKKKFGW